MQSTGQASPEVQLTAEKYVGTGYQRLLTFEVPGGGFSLFGNPPAEVFLTAYGLMEFNDMAKVYPVDPALIQRTAQWLMDQQEADGTWSDRGYSEHWQIDSEAPTTAYITWALIEAGYEDTPQVGQAIGYLREFGLQQEDAYGLALVANALAVYDPDHSTTRAVMDRLYGMRVEEGDIVYWQADLPSFMGATDESGSLETGHYPFAQSLAAGQRANRGGWRSVYGARQPQQGANPRDRHRREQRRRGAPGRLRSRLLALRGQSRADRVGRGR
jgi:hypothetical protein